MSTNDDTTVDMDKILNRVRKMMALANDAGASEGERDNALRMAHATLAKYNLSMSQAEATSGKDDGKRVEDKDLTTSDMPWVIRTAAAVGKLYFCKYFYIRIRGKGRAINCFVGREANVTTAREMAQYVIRSIQSEANRVQRERFEDGRWNRDFCKGAADRVYERCEEIRLNAERASQDAKTPGTSLVLASVYKTEMAANDKWLADQGVKLGKAKGRERGAGWDAHAAGRDFGGKVSLHNQVGGAGTKRIK